MYNEYPDEFYDLVDQFVASGRYGGRPEAADAVRTLRPDLCPTPAGRNTPTTGSSAAAQLDRLAKKLASEQGISFAQAYVEVLNQNPRLYEAYLREHLERLGGGASRV